MRHPIVYMLAMLITSCQAFPQIADDLEKIETEDCITVKVTRDAIAKDTDVSVDVKVSNKDANQLIPRIQQ